MTLFNRVNSQTVRTKYMSVENRQLCAKNVTWSAFQILLVNPSSSDDKTAAGSHAANPSVGPGTAAAPLVPSGSASSSTSSRSASASSSSSSLASDMSGPAASASGVPKAVAGPGTIITYGSHVVLRCMETNVYSGTLVVKKVVGDTVHPDATGAVSQMQKIALALPNRESLYLSISPTVDVAGGSPFLCYQPFPASAKSQLDAYLVWTIVGVERSVYRFAELSAPLASRSQVLSQVFEATLQKNVLELHGRHFGPDSAVCIGSQPIMSHVLSPSKISCVLPPPLAEADFDRVTAQLGYGRRMFAAILVARSDGVIMHTGNFLVSERNGDGPVTMRTVSSI